MGYYDIWMWGSPGFDSNIESMVNSDELGDLMTPLQVR